MKYLIKKSFHLILISFWVILFINSSVIAEEDRIEVGIDEKLGEFLPADAQFINSKGDTILLGDLIKEPTILSLVYYECPGICSPLLTELGWVIGKVDLEAGVDYQIVTISIDKTETPEIARRWKRNYFAGMKKEIPEDSWTFLVGDSSNIYKVTNSLGYYFKNVGEEFTHPGAIIAISPKGKISRYILGTQFNPFDIKMALIDAESGKTNPTIAKMLQFCFSYDPDGRGYSLNVTRIAGVIVLFSIGILMLVLIFKKKKVNGEQIKKKKGVLING